MEYLKLYRNQIHDKTTRLSDIYDYKRANI